MAAKRVSCALLIVALAVAAVALPQTRVTYNQDIAPLIYRSCLPCHRPGGSGPFPLLTYADARRHAHQIAAVTRTRFMPPWLPEPGYGHFEGPGRLSAREIALIQRWVEQGAVEGDWRSRPPLPHISAGWQLGKPDLVVRPPRSYELPPRAEGSRDVFRNLIIPAPVSSPRYVRAIELRPGNVQTFHHANILLDRTGWSRLRDGKDGQPGFAGMDLEIESDRFDPDSHFLFWKPGTPPAFEPPGMQWRLDPGTDLVLNLHMRPSGKPELIQPEVALYFTDQPPSRLPMLLQLENDRAISIPPGARKFVVTDDFQLPLDVQVLAIYPHAHYLGKEVQGFATLPGGARQWLIWIKDWNLDWQGVFRYRQPVALPRGTILHMRWTYDNSSANVRNPSHPPKRVVAGNQATDEMGHLWLQVLPVSSPGSKTDPRLILQLALMRHRAAKDPGDYLAHFNLGAALEAMGKPAEAIAEYRRVLELRPEDAVAHNNLGAALQSMGNTEDAIAEYQRALKAQPDYLQAHYNLGSAWLSQGKAEEACREFRQVLSARPDDSEAHANLGRALALQGRNAEAAAQFEQALKFDPQNGVVHYDLGRILAEQRDFARAILEFEAALRLDPANASAHSDLGAVYAIQGRLEQAVAEFEAALRIDPGLTVARDNLKRAQARLAERN
jgi:Flp pilus assembly protein TadD